MKHRYKLLTTTLLIPLLSSCNIDFIIKDKDNTDDNSDNNDNSDSYNKKEEAVIDLDKLNDPNASYTMINNYFNNESINYYKETKGELKSKRGLKEDVISLTLKDGNYIYSQKGTTSTYYGSYASQIFYDLENKNYGLGKGESTFTDEYLTSTSYDMLSFYSESNYLSSLGASLNNITNFRVSENKESLSFKSSSILNESEDEITYFYEVSVESEKDTNNNYTKIDATKYEKNEILNYIDFETISISNASFTLSFDKSSLFIKSIKVNESVKLNTIDFDYTYTSTFSKISDELPKEIENMKVSVKNNVTESGGFKKDEIYEMYVSLNNKYKNLNYYTYINASASAMGGMYNQTVKGFKLKNEDDYLFTTITTSAFVSKAEMRYENQKEDKYMIASGNKPDASSTYGSVSSWNDFTSYTKEGYLNVLGHLMDNITNYIVSDDNPSASFLEASKKENDNERIYTFKASFTEDETHINSLKDFFIENAYMSGMGTPTYYSSSFSMYLKKDSDEIIKIVQKEKYKTGSFTIDYSGTTNFVIFDNIDEIPSEISSLYKERIN